MSLPARLIPLVHTVADLLDRMGLSHAFGGALANNYWGVVRATQDLDVLVLLPAIRYQEFATALNDAGFRHLASPDGPEELVEVSTLRGMVQDRRMMVVYREGIKTEFFVPFLPLQDEILRRAARLSFEGRTIPVTTAEDLILLKMVFHRDKDLRDIRGIIAAQGDALDLAYLRLWQTRMLEDDRITEMERLLRRDES